MVLNRIAAVLLIASGLAIAWPLAAVAQVSRTWISAAGDDANPCTRVSPCVSLDVAMSKTAPYGEVDCVGPINDVGGTITKSIVIDCNAGVVVNSGDQNIPAGEGLVIQAGANDVVVLRGLHLSGIAPDSGLDVQESDAGVFITTAASVIIEHCVIGSFRQFGILVEATGDTRLVVHDSQLIDDGSPLVTAGEIGGILVSTSGHVGLSVTDTVIAHSEAGGGSGAAGLSAWISGTGRINGVVAHTLIAGTGGEGVLADGEGGQAGANISIMLDQLTLTGGSFALDVRGPGTGLIAGRTSISGFGNALPALGGVLYSYGDNTVNGNGTDGAFTAVIPTE
jgi:hypothetical protein